MKKIIIITLLFAIFAHFNICKAQAGMLQTEGALYNYFNPLLFQDSYYFSAYSYDYETGQDMYDEYLLDIETGEFANLPDLYMDDIRLTPVHMLYNVYNDSLTALVSSQSADSLVLLTHISRDYSGYRILADLTSELPRGSFVFGPNESSVGMKLLGTSQLVIYGKVFPDNIKEYYFFAEYDIENDSLQDINRLMGDVRLLDDLKWIETDSVADYVVLGYGHVGMITNDRVRIIRFNSVPEYNGIDEIIQVDNRYVGLSRSFDITTQSSKTHLFFSDMNSYEDIFLSESSYFTVSIPFIKAKRMSYDGEGHLFLVNMGTEINSYWERDLLHFFSEELVIQKIDIANKMADWEIRLKKGLLWQPQYSELLKDGRYFIAGTIMDPSELKNEVTFQPGFFYLLLSSEGDIISSNTSAHFLKFRIFPNPSTHFSTIIGENLNGSWMTLYGMDGSKIQRIHCSDSEYKLDMENLTNGTYFLQITDKNGHSTTEKLIKLGR